MNMKGKQLLCVVVAFVFLFSALAQEMVYATESSQSVEKTNNLTIPEGLDYGVVTDSTGAEVILIYGYNGTETQLTIPSEIDGKPVAGISRGDSWGALTRIVLPASMTDWWDSGPCFSCSSLEEIEVEEGNTKYGAQDGFLYEWIKQKGEGGEEIITGKTLICCPQGKKGVLNVPEGITRIGSEAFRGCSELTEINFPEGVTELESGAMQDCIRISRVTFPKSLTKLGGYLFSTIVYNNFTSLTELMIPEHVNDISRYAFADCKGLQKIEVEPENPVFSSGNGILYRNGGTELFSCPQGREGKEIIPDTTVIIGEGAFYGCDKLTEIEIPGSVTEIGDLAFRNCESLKELRIPASVTSIGSGVEEDEYRYTLIVDQDVTLLVTKGSAAESYAQKNGLNYRYVEQVCSHNYVKSITQAPSCTTAGTAVFTCANCGNSYTESIPASGHVYQTVTITATPKADGSITEACSRCGDVKSSQVIYAATKAALSETSYVYNGKIRKPGVVLRDSQKNLLVENRDYTLSYASRMKNVGKYTISIILKGNYSGSIKKQFTIRPKSAKISKIKGISGGFTVKWKKQTEQTTGYEISYSTGKNFAGKTTKTSDIKKNKTTAKTVSKLKAKKKYYVRIRTYKKVKGSRIYSDWSKVKAVTTKK